MKEPTDFFAALFNGAEGFVEFRSIRNGKARARFHPLPLNGLPPFAATHDHYFGVAPRVRQSGKARDVEAVPTLWMDVDVKGFKDKADALGRLKGFPQQFKKEPEGDTLAQLTPSVIVDTGHGYHAYWLLTEPIKPVEATELMLALRAAINPALDNVADPPRILRVPGTVNVKDPASPLPVEIVQFEPEHRLSPDTFHTLKTVWDRLDAAGLAVAHAMMAERKRKEAAITSDVAPGKKNSESDLLFALTRNIPASGEGTPFDGRNKAAAVIAGHYLRTMNAAHARAAFNDWNHVHCSPPLSAEEAETVFKSIARRETFKRGEDTASDTPEDRALEIQAMGEHFKVPLTDIRLLTGTPPRYEFLFLSASPITISAYDLPSQWVWQRAVFAATGYPPTPIGKKAALPWEHYLRRFHMLAQVVDAGDEATNTGELKGWLQWYLDQNQPRDDTESVPERPRRKDGQIFIHARALLGAIKSEYDVRLEHKAFIQTLKANRFERAQLNVQISGGKWVSRTMWAIPQGWYENDEKVPF